MPAFNLNCRLPLFHGEENATVETMQHTKLSSARLRFPFLAARISRHAMPGAWASATATTIRSRAYSFA